MAEYIEREALMDLYDMGKEFEEYAKVLSVPIPIILQNIKDIPAADVAPVRHGRWVQTPEYDRCWCSRCKKQYTGFFASYWNYCPNCGATMDLEG